LQHNVIRFTHCSHMGSILLVLLPAIAFLIYANLDGHILKNLGPNKKWLPKLLVFCTFAACLLEIYKNSVDSKLATQQRTQAEEDRKQAAKDRKQAAADQTQSQAKIDQLKQDINQKALEYQQNLQEARFNFLKAQSEAEIRAIGTEFSEFADSFPTNKQELLAHINDLKRDLKVARANAQSVAQATQRKAHLEFTAKVYAPIYFALHFVQESVRAYALRTGDQVKIDPVELPDDLYEHPVNTQIVFPTGAIWSLNIRADDEPVAWFSVIFTDPQHHKTGELYTPVNPGRHILSFGYSADPSLPDPSTINGDFPLSDYETPIKRAYQKVMSMQLLYTLPQ
jgi:hypothetical protein